jgi:hypothetical protein
MSAPDIVQLALGLSRLLAEMEDIGSWPTGGGGDVVMRARTVAEPDPTGDAATSAQRARLRRRARQLRQSAIRHLERAHEQATTAIVATLDPELARRLREAEEITRVSSARGSIPAAGGRSVPGAAPESPRP